MDTMGARIRMLREARGITQDQLADKIGTTKASISQWELDQVQHIRLPVFLRLCDALGCTPHYLVFGPPRTHRDTPLKNSGGNAS